MDQILDQILDQIWRFFEHEGISLNTNVLETGIINNGLLIIILILGYITQFREGVVARKMMIEQSIQDAEMRLIEANKCLAKISEEYNQLYVLFANIKKTNSSNLIAVLEPDSYQSKKDLAERFEEALERSKSKERQTFLEIKHETIRLLLYSLGQTLDSYYGMTGPKYHKPTDYDMQFSSIQKLRKYEGSEIGNFLSTESVPAIYARGLLDFQKNKPWSIGIHIRQDILDLQDLVAKSPELIEYFNTPRLSQKAKHEVLAKTLEREVSSETFDFLRLLVNRNRINILPAIISNYLSLVDDDDAVRVKKVEIITAKYFTPLQEELFISIFKNVIKAKNLKITYNYDPSLITGFIVKVKSNIIDLSMKGELQQYARHFDTVLEI